MNEKINKMINKCLNEFPADSKNMFRELSEYAVSLGYTPKWVKIRVEGKAINGNSLTFTKSKVNRTLMKIKPSGNPHSPNMPCLVLTFFASADYSELFRQGIQRVIEEFDGRYTGCYGCGKCKDKLQGYTYIYSDGRNVFRCGGELIELPPISENDISEVKKLMKTQDDFFLKLIQ